MNKSCNDLHINMSIYIKIFIIYFLSAVLLGGCSTTSLWENPTYTDSINRFLATEDGKNFVFIGEKYHYVFDNHKSLKQILLWKDRAVLKAIFHEKFILDNLNHISGNLRVICECKNATATQISWIENRGFIKSRASDAQFYSLLGIETEALYILEIRLSGVRYLANDLALDKYAKLNKTYKVVIEEPKSTSGVIGRVLLTPISVAEDGIAVIGFIPIVAVGVPFWLVGADFSK